MKSVGGKGEKSFHAKLTQEQVDELREIAAWRRAVAEALADKVLARHFGVNHHQIRKIIAGVSWK